MSVQLVLILGEEGALAAGLLVVHLEDVRREPLRAGRLVVAQHTHVRLGVGVEVPLEAPVVSTWQREKNCDEFAINLQK